MTQSEKPDVFNKQVVESLPSPAEMTEMEIEYRRTLLAHWTQIQNHALVEGCDYHRDR